MSNQSNDEQTQNIEKYGAIGGEIKGFDGQLIK